MRKRPRIIPNTDIFQDPTEFDQISTLPNGIRVATEALPGPFSGIGVYIDAGSRYENGELSGVSHIIDRLAFKVRLLYGSGLRGSLNLVNDFENFRRNARVIGKSWRKHPMRFVKGISHVSVCKL